MLVLGMSNVLLEGVSVLSRLGVPDLLADGEPRPVDEIAAAVGAHGPTLYRLLRLLADIGVVAEPRDAASP